MKEIRGFSHHEEAVPYPFVVVNLVAHRNWIITGHAIVTHRMEKIDAGLVREVDVTRIERVWLVSLILEGDLEIYDIGYSRNMDMAYEIRRIVKALIGLR